MKRNRRVAKANVRRFRSRVRQMQIAWSAGNITLEHIRQRMMSWLGHARQGSAEEWQRAVFGNILFRKGDGQ